MTTIAMQRAQKLSSNATPLGGGLQRKCACGSIPERGGECAECKMKEMQVPPIIQRPASSSPSSIFSSPPHIPRTSLTVNTPGDKYEVEADSVADSILSSTSPIVHDRSARSQDKFVELSHQNGTSVQRAGTQVLANAPDEDQSANRSSSESQGSPIREQSSVKPDALNWPVIAKVSLLNANTLETHGGDSLGIAAHAAQAAVNEIGLQLFGRDRISSAVTLSVLGVVGNPPKDLEDVLHIVLPDVLLGIISPGSANADYQLTLAFGPMPQSPDRFSVTLGIMFNERGSSKLLEKATSGISAVKHGVGDLLQRDGSSSTTPKVPPIVYDVLSSQGEPLDGGTRSFFESRFNQDFSHVRIHTDSNAARSAAAVQSHAYTVGSHIVFAMGEHRPQTRSGMRLIAHELTHVVQQSGSDAAISVGKTEISTGGGIARIGGRGVLQRQLKHDPDGPYHAPEGTRLKCTDSDDCSSLSTKIGYLDHMVESHRQWDLANPRPGYPRGRHSEQEIPDLQSALDRCKQFHMTKCRDQPKWIPVRSFDEVKESIDKLVGSGVEMIKVASEFVHAHRGEIADEIGIAVSIVMAAGAVLLLIAAGMGMLAALAQVGVSFAAFAAVVSLAVKATAGPETVGPNV